MVSTIQFDSKPLLLVVADKIRLEKLGLPSSWPTSPTWYFAWASTVQGIYRAALGQLSNASIMTRLILAGSYPSFALVSSYRCATGWNPGLLLEAVRQKMEREFGRA